jgi:hypothetical protein
MSQWSAAHGNIPFIFGEWSCSVQQTNATARKAWFDNYASMLRAATNLYAYSICERQRRSAGRDGVLDVAISRSDTALSASTSPHLTPSPPALPAAAGDDDGWYETYNRGARTWDAMVLQALNIA